MKSNNASKLILWGAVLGGIGTCPQASAQSIFINYSPFCYKSWFVPTNGIGYAACSVNGENDLYNEYSASAIVFAYRCGYPATLRANAVGTEGSLFAYSTGSAGNAYTYYDTWTYPDGDKISFGGEWVPC